jgi:signal recognition particle subunit SRP54
MYKKQQGKRPLLAACDIYRPAAIKQLEVLGEQIDVPVFTLGSDVSPVKIAKETVAYAIKNNNDMVFLDTAGRLHIDEELMAELREIKDSVSPTEILLVVDAMTGQDAVNVAKSFNELLDITGVILTKLDGDTRGGAALSVRHVTDKPIKFIGTGEKIDNIEPFHPDRMAQRILGMGDVLTLIEKAQQQYDEKQAEELERKFRESSFTLTDYLEQLGQIKNMGSLESLLSMMPGMNSAQLKGTKIDERALTKTEAIILSMTPYERDHPEIIGSSRKKRIAAGSGTSVEEVNRLLKQFEQMKKMIKQLTGRQAEKFLRLTKTKRKNKSKKQRR